MLSFSGFVSCMLVLSTAFVVVQSLTLGRVDGGRKILCTHAVSENADEDLSSSYRRILIQNESGSYDGYGAENSPSHRGFLNDDDGIGENDEERTDLEWKKIRRYIKRQLKVPKRYLKKIVRTLTMAASLRSVDDDDDGLVPSPETDVLNSILARANGQYDTNRLLVVDEPESVKYFAVIAAPGNRMFQ